MNKTPEPLIIQDLIDGQAAFDYLTKLALSPKLAYTLTKLGRAMKRVMRDFNDTRDGIIEKRSEYDEEKEAWIIHPRDMMEHNQEIRELRKQPVEGFEKLTVSSKALIKYLQEKDETLEAQVFIDAWFAFSDLEDV